MAYNDPQLLHVDQVLTNISVGYDNAEFVAEQLAPTVRVSKTTDKYNVYERLGQTLVDDIRAPRTPANLVPPRKLSRDSYFLEEHALMDMVEPESAEEADAGTVDEYADATENLVDTILMNREYALVQMVTDPNNYATDNSTTLSGTDQWSNYSASDPIGDVKTAVDTVLASIGRLPTKAIFGYEVARKMEDHTKIIDRIKYAQRGISTDQILAEFFGIPSITRALTRYNTNTFGQDYAGAYLWGKNVVLAYVPSNPGKRTPAFMYEFTKGYSRAGGAIMPTERWYDQDIDADKIRVRRRYDLKFIAVDDVSTGKAVGGYLIADAIA